MQSTAVLEEPESRQDVRHDNSSLVEDVIRSNREIERRGRLLLRDSSDITDMDELMAYSSTASDIGYGEMERIGSEILREGGTFPAMRITRLRRHGRTYVLDAVEVKTGMEFSLPIGGTLKQYIGDPIDPRPGALEYYMGKDVTIDVARIDVARRASGYKVVMIGLTDDVLGDAPQATRLDLLY